MKSELLSAAMPEAGELQIFCFSVGKADAFLLRTACSAVLIDTGTERAARWLVRQLKHLGVDQLEMLVITHYHADHTGGAERILRDLRVRQVFECPCLKSKERKEWEHMVRKREVVPVPVQRRFVVTLDGVDYLLDPPARSQYPHDTENNASLIVEVVHGENRLLFLADAREERLQEYLAHCPGVCALVKMPHHGRYMEALPALVQATDPEFAVLTASDDQPESEKTVALLRLIGCNVSLTRQGTAAFESDGAKLTKIPFA